MPLSKCVIYYGRREYVFSLTLWSFLFHFWGCLSMASLLLSLLLPAFFLFFLFVCMVDWWRVVCRKLYWVFSNLYFFFQWPMRFCTGCMNAHLCHALKYISISSCIWAEYCSCLIVFSLFLLKPCKCRPNWCCKEPYRVESWNYIRYISTLFTYLVPNKNKSSYFIVFSFCFYVLQLSWYQKLSQQQRPCSMLGL